MYIFCTKLDVLKVERYRSKDYLPAVYLTLRLPLHSASFVQTRARPKHSGASACVRLFVRVFECACVRDTVYPDKSFLYKIGSVGKRTSIVNGLNKALRHFKAFPNLCEAVNTLVSWAFMNKRRRFQVHIDLAVFSLQHL